MENKRNRNWCFTLNNYTPVEEEEIQALESRYLTYGHEIGESGTPHLQGTIVFANAVRFNTVKRLFPVRVHLEPCIDLHKSITYCQKDGLVFESGEPPKTSKQKGEMEKIKWDEAREQAEATGSFEDSSLQIRYCRNAEWMFTRKKMKIKHDNLDHLDNYWYYGPTGTGKSKTAREKFAGCYVKLQNKWWDGYIDEETVLIDDLDKRQEWIIPHLKHWADRYPFPIETKGGGGFQIRPKRIVVTSNWHPKEIWETQMIWNQSYVVLKLFILENLIGVELKI